MRNYDYLFKILVLGDCGVGKSCLLMRFSDDRFTEKYVCTVGIDFRVRSVEVTGRMVMLQIWDTAGDERFKSLLPSYYRGATGILLVYDITSSKSFRSIDGWLEEIHRMCPESVNVLLVGNKCDDLDNRQVRLEQGFNYANLRAIGFHEVSAKSGANVNDVFNTLSVGIYNRLVLCTPNRLPAGQEAEEDTKDPPDEPIKFAGKDRQGTNGNNTCC
ncbi:ras-related protein RIC1 [Drosophila sechellia]|uniref:GM11275 n=1 Tax=Drosophila sechellia TaxID=7238 RepID=B4IDW2_DROSE|nr:ras-related protein RIC1 [Drosophila sechellia]EDW45770.1 GM11275 [Drosophila sechellia]